MDRETSQRDGIAQAFWILGRLGDAHGCDMRPVARVYPEEVPSGVRVDSLLLEDDRFACADPMLALETATGPTLYRAVPLESGPGVEVRSVRVERVADDLSGVLRGFARRCAKTASGLHRRDKMDRDLGPYWTPPDAVKQYLLHPEPAMAQSARLSLLKADRPPVGARTDVIGAMRRACLLACDTHLKGWVAASGCARQTSVCFIQADRFGEIGVLSSVLSGMIDEVVGPSDGHIEPDTGGESVQDVSTAGLEVSI